MERHRSATRGSGFVPLIAKLGPSAFGDCWDAHEFQARGPAEALPKLRLRAFEHGGTLRVALQEREIRKSLKREPQHDLGVHYLGAPEHVEIASTGGGQIALETKTDAIKPVCDEGGALVTGRMEHRRRLVEMPLRRLDVAELHLGHRHPDQCAPGPAAATASTAVARPIATAA